ncbi:MAG: hypothetical protein IPK78_18375 [Rhodospirillales bacterium]|nr:hypothetical protein [Rhodospirillales bacterium]
MRLIAATFFHAVAFSSFALMPLPTFAQGMPGTDKVQSTVEDKAKEAIQEKAQDVMKEQVPGTGAPSVSGGTPAMPSSGGMPAIPGAPSVPSIPGR